MRTFIAMGLTAIALAQRMNAQGIVLTSDAPAKLGLDPERLQQASAAAEQLPALSSLLVWRRGALGYEQYFHGGSREAPVNVKSVSKSFLSALVGIAIAEHKVWSLDQPIAEILPEYYAPNGGTIFKDARARSDSLRRTVTLRHLLTMSSGLAWDEGSATMIYALMLSSNPVRFAAELPVLRTPGASFDYATASTALLAGALARLTRESPADFGERVLFGPVGITVAHWDADPEGVNFGGSEMFLKTRDMLKLGILYLHGGKVDDRQVVPAKWVEESTARKYDVTQEEYRAMVPHITGYGYLWWLRTAAGHDMVCALGLGGQFVLIVPSLDMVMAGTSRLDATSPGTQRQFVAIFDLVDRFVVAAAH